jgi:sugar lactone lactonase YvrE
VAYRLDADLSLHRLCDGLIVSNGPCWSPDGRLFYFGDSGRKTIWVHDYDPAFGTIANARIFAVEEGATATVDGATIDAEGYLWSARVYSGRLVRHAPDGSIDRVLDMPVRDVTSVMFGGPELDILFITSMASSLSSALPRDSPLRGSILAVRNLGVRGIPEPLFDG